MGASKFNPRSTQFTGQLPAEMLLAGLEVHQRIKPEWIAANPNSMEKPPDEMVEVAIMMVISRTEPSALFRGDPEQWPRAQSVPIGPVILMTENGPTPAVLTLAAWRQMTPIGGRTEPVPSPTGPSILGGGDDGPPWAQ